MVLLGYKQRPLEHLEQSLQKFSHQPLPLVGEAKLDDAIVRINTLLRLEAQLQDLREHERLYWARRLHDGVLQDLVALQLQYTHMPQPREAIDAFQHAICELRQGIAHIAPPELAILGLEAAIEAYAASVNIQVFGLHTDSTQAWQQLTFSQQLDIYRLCEHALNNAVRHGAASEMHVQTSTQANRIWLRLQDNGIGTTLPIQLGLGLQLTQTQLRLKNGDLQLYPLSHATGCVLECQWQR